MSTECGKRREIDAETLVCNKASGNHLLCSGWSERTGGYVDWENPAYEPPKSTGDKPGAESRLRAMASKLTGAEGAERAAASWSDTERKLVMAAITEVAESQDEFTTDEVWTALGDTVKKTAGMAAMLKQATAQGFIAATDKYRDSRRERGDHDSGRRLRVWASRMR